MQIRFDAQLLASVQLVSPIKKTRMRAAAMYTD